MNTLLACLLAFVNPIVDMDMSDPDCTSADGSAKSFSPAVVSSPARYASPIPSGRASRSASRRRLWIPLPATGSI